MIPVAIVSGQYITDFVIPDEPTANYVDSPSHSSVKIQVMRPSSSVTGTKIGRYGKIFSGGGGGMHPMIENKAKNININEQFRVVFVCFYGCVVCPAGMCGRRDDVRSVQSAYINRFLTGIVHTRKNTQKSKFLLSQAFKWKKIMFFVIPEMSSKTFVMLQKNFLITLSTKKTYS